MPSLVSAAATAGSSGRRRNRSVSPPLGVSDALDRFVVERSVGGLMAVRIVPPEVIFVIFAFASDGEGDGFPIPGMRNFRLAEEPHIMIFVNDLNV